MILRTIFLTTLPLFLCLTSVAQDPCGTTDIHRERMRNPNSKARYDNSNAVTRTAVARSHARTQDAGTVYTIPVVFHIMHRGEPVGTGINISDERIFACIQEMNEQFRNIPGRYADGHSVDMQIQFALAVRDPEGNCTNGINRVDMSGYPDYMDYGMDDPGMDELEVKALSFWDSHYYANVWVVSHAYGYGGFAHYAYEHGSVKDGVVATHGIVNSAAMTHEFGHYLNLLHTFDGWDGVNCASNNNCINDGDLVCDTPPQIPGAACELSPNECVPGEDLAATNYMSYSCQQDFTEGQKERALIAVTLLRSSLLEENGNLALVPVGLPEPDFSMTTGGVCPDAGTAIMLSDRTRCIPQTFIPGTQASYQWTMTNDDGAMVTSTDQNPTLLLPAKGVYDITLTVTTAQGTNSVTRHDIIVADERMPQAASCVAEVLGASDPERIDDIGIQEVILNDLHHISGSSIEDAAAFITNANGYGDFSCIYTATLEPATEYVISVRLADYYEEHVRVYIDFGNNGITDTDLVTFADNIPLGSGLYALPPFTTPSTPFYNTRLRMRVADSDSYEAPPEACGAGVYYGQVQDYAVMFSNNIPPVANDDEITINEDGIAVIPAGANDTDADGTILSSVDFNPMKIFPQGDSTTAEGNWKYSSGNIVTFTPIPDFNGVATMQYTISDNVFEPSLPATITVTVTPVNDAPSFIKGANQLVNADDGAQLVEGWATAMSAGPGDESSQELTFIVTNNNTALFSVQPFINVSGDLSYTPVSGKHGTANISVVLKDDGGTVNDGIDSVKQIFTITVEPSTVTGVEADFQKVLVYPNPSSGIFRLSVPPSLHGSAVKVTALSGSVIYESKINNETVIDLSRHAKGMYVLVIESNGRKLVIQIVRH